MENKGSIWASDRALRRLETLRQRCVRGEPLQRSDGALGLVANACPRARALTACLSHAGALQRRRGDMAAQSHARWTTRAEDVTELAEIQAACWRTPRRR
jgi:hypothetical protein